MICKRRFEWAAAVAVAGLPDGLFFKPKIQIWVNFGGPWNGKC
jgi:hypothetical protein